MVDQAAHEDGVNYYCANYHGRSFLSPFFKENQYGIYTGGQESHDQEIHHELKVGIGGP